MFSRTGVCILDSGMAGKRFDLLLGVILFQITFAFGSNCNWQYFQHYDQKGCTAVLGDDGCPVRFHCEKLSPEDLKTCVHNGRIYKHREKIHVEPCDSCKCQVDEDSASIECASVDCPQWEPENESCYMGYKPKSCCPTEMCPAKDKDESKTCSHNGKQYKIGQHIETSEPCESCICTETWTGEGGPGCSLVDCKTGIYAKDIRRGCLPIYTGKGCCAIEMYCGDIFDATPASLGDDEVKDDHCVYQGRYYERGSTASLKTDRSHCVTCTCATPPDFTCLKKTCSDKPRADCKVKAGPCCPEYECP